MRLGQNTIMPRLQVLFPIILCVIGVLGCSSSDSTDSAALETRPTQASGTQSELPPKPEIPQDTWTTTPAQQQPAVEELPPLVKSIDRQNEPKQTGDLRRADSPVNVSVDNDLTEAAKRLQLRADLTPDELQVFLAGADKDMQMIASGRTAITDQQKALAEMKRIVRLKLEASRRLSEHADASDQAKQEAARGELQSLSHLAALGDVKAAVELEALAKSNLDSNDPNLVFDSRLVLIGFAIESLQNGKQDAPQQIVQLIESLGKAASDSEDANQSPGIAALMVMGQARQMLVQYNQVDEAAIVRQTILDRFANAADPQIAKMAAQMAGTSEYDNIDVMLQKSIDGETIAVDDWVTAMQALIRESPDLQTVQYLAGAALQFEGLEQLELAEATYEQLADSFSDPIPATGKETQLAIQARQNRKNAIGKTFDPDLDTLTGTPIAIADYRGQIVLMPFWAMTFPESLQLVPALEEIANQSSGKIAIIGMNLDPKDAPVLEFIKQHEMPFPSYRSETSDSEQVANEVAARFGMVSAPFVVIIDQQGKVTSIAYTRSQVEKAIEQLLRRSSPRD
ncbi:thiol-disulfide oxidoreductase [Novipirellula aureliae]|uniref:Thiol-disulfide oxidoreductase n=1 Tax=Novipirellula aureliae TaxID=2527966 RepID=A0A5C6DFQ9_9BACT|nr:TlpA disulfide reductase family protein [Novipirellula aureliae]TWU34571.1 thiol-disulfide oxidoreductase [Novipirellula aureliae]